MQEFTPWQKRYLSWMKVKHPQQASSFKGNKFITFMFTADITMSLSHEIKFFIQ